MGLKIFVVIIISAVIDGMINQEPAALTSEISEQTIEIEIYTRLFDLNTVYKTWSINKIKVEHCMKMLMEHCVKMLNLNPKFKGCVRFETSIQPLSLCIAALPLTRYTKLLP